jgi:hypothetical protein
VPVLDEVAQYLVEEAAHLMHTQKEVLGKASSAEGNSAPSLTPHQELGQRHAAAMRGGF